MHSYNSCVYTEQKQQMKSNVFLTAPLTPRRIPVQASDSNQYKEEH
jgi:hypothetical protein